PELLKQPARLCASVPYAGAPMISTLALVALAADPAAAATPAKAPSAPTVAVFVTAQDAQAAVSAGRLEIDLGLALDKQGMQRPELEAMFPGPKLSAE